MYIPRIQIANIKKLMAPNKVIILYGARRVGKTTLVNKFIKETSEQGFNKEDILYVTGDDIIARQFLESQSIQKLKDFVGGKKDIDH